MMAVTSFVLSLICAVGLVQSAVVPTYATAASGIWTGTPVALTKVQGTAPPQASHGLDPPGNTSYTPTYRAKSAFDYASCISLSHLTEVVLADSQHTVNLALYQEWIELDLFHYGIKTFSTEQWAEMGVGPDVLSLLNFMANQETGHAQLLTNILGPGAAKQCTYNYSGAFDSPRSYVDFNQRLTRWGESGVWGFLTLLNSRDSAHLLSQSIATEARQQMIFRQMSGGQAMPVFFESGIPQSWAWTLLQRWIQSCPKDNPRVEWTVFPELRIRNQPRLFFENSKASISTNRTALTRPGETIAVEWDEPGRSTGPDLSYKTSVNTTDPPKYAMLVAQLNATYVPLQHISGNTASFYLPNYTELFGSSDISLGNNVLNGTGFVALTSKNLPVTPFNMSLVNKYVVAGPAIIQFG